MRPTACLGPYLGPRRQDAACDVMRSDGSGDGAGKAVLPPPSWPRPPRHKVARLTLSFRHAMREKLYAREACQ